ncbi:MAG: hypothetical protein Tsb0013_02520 [Phycisphaerales bacterium]
MQLYDPCVDGLHAELVNELVYSGDDFDAIREDEETVGGNRVPPNIGLEGGDRLVNVALGEARDLADEECTVLGAECADVRDAADLGELRLGESGEELENGVDGLIGDVEGDGLGCRLVFEHDADGMIQCELCAYVT